MKFWCLCKARNDSVWKGHMPAGNLSVRLGFFGVLRENNLATHREQTQILVGGIACLSHAAAFFKEQHPIGI